MVTLLTKEVNKDKVSNEIKNGAYKRRIQKGKQVVFSKASGTHTFHDVEQDLWFRTRKAKKLIGLNTKSIN